MHCIFECWYRTFWCALPRVSYHPSYEVPHTMSSRYTRPSAYVVAITFSTTEACSRTVVDINTPDNFSKLCCERQRCERVTGHVTFRGSGRLHTPSGRITTNQEGASRQRHCSLFPPPPRGVVRKRTGTDTVLKGERLSHRERVRRRTPARKEHGSRRTGQGGREVPEIPCPSHSARSGENEYTDGSRQR